MTNTRAPMPTPPTKTESTLMASLSAFTATLSVGVALSALNGGSMYHHGRPLTIALICLAVLLVWMNSFRVRLRRAERGLRARVNRRGA